VTRTTKLCAVIGVPCSRAPNYPVRPARTGGGNARVVRR
jgi:hypothetical protein